MSIEFSQLVSQTADETFQEKEPARIIREPINLVDPVPEMLAYDASDVYFRYQNLRDFLTESEVERVAVADETLHLVSHLAEISELEVYPYQLVLLGEELGSLVEIVDDSGKDLWVFRSMNQMLESRVRKFPKDERSVVMRDLFRDKVSPTVREMKSGDVLMYASPPDPDAETEFKYGFVYLLRKNRTEQNGRNGFSAVSIKVDWDRSQYEKVFGLTRDGSYREIVNKLAIVDGSSLSMEEIVAGVVEHSGGNILPFNWFNDQLVRYAEVIRFVEQWKDAVVADIGSGEKLRLRQTIEMMQLAWLEKDRPEIYSQVQQEVRIFGNSQLAVACGLLQFGRFNFDNGLDLLLRGFGSNLNELFGDSELYVWTCGSCGHKHEINVPLGILKEFCDKCGKSGKCA